MARKKTSLHRCTYKGCNSVFNRPYRLAQHLLVHNNIKGFQCPESNCNKAYTNKSHLDRHINSAHKDVETDMIYSCLTCIKRFANRQNLKKHINIYHKVKVRFSCDICRLQFLKKHQLTAHMHQHTGIKSFSCEICLIEFVSLSEKKKHARNHKTYSCLECLSKFDRWSKYQKHMKSEHIKEFICNECDRHFKQRSHMIRHVRSHLKINTRAFLCPYENCERVYSRNSNLKQHILSNHEKIKYKCKICEAQLSTKAKLIEHLMKLHSQPKVEPKPPKTKLTGRRERKDMGSMRGSVALKLAGIKNEFTPEIIDVEF